MPQGNLWGSVANAVKQGAAGVGDATGSTARSGISLWSKLVGHGEDAPHAHSSFWPSVYAHVVGNLATLGALALLYFSWMLFEQVAPHQSAPAT